MPERKGFTHFLIVGAILLLLSTCGLCLWIFGLQTAVFRATLPVYPEAQEVSNAVGHYGSDILLHTSYFWTPDSLAEVREYYETFALPFIEKEYWFTFGVDKHYRTVFNPSNASLPVLTAEFTGETIDPAESRFCYYRIPYQCVEVELLDFGQSDLVILRPPSGPMRQVATPAPLPPDLRGGTLIVYMYYVDGW